MNLNIKKLTALSGVSLLAFLTTFQPLTNADAALTPPSSYDYAYKWNTTESEWNIIGTTGSSLQIYSRTSDGAYFNYTTTRTLISGLNVTMTFNRSNTDWFSSLGGYEPGQSKIGSNNTVGDGFIKNTFIFNNQTNNDYYLYFDVNSTGSAAYYANLYNDYIVGNEFYDDGFNYIAEWSLYRQLIPAKYTFTLQTANTSSARYFDAWYLKDLGTSTAFNLGYLDGEADGYAQGLGNNPNILLNGFTAMIGILVNFFLMIVNLQVFGISALNIFSIVVVFVGIVWILKIIRG
jgi:hypothetical protein